MNLRPNAPTIWLALMHAHSAMDKAALESIRHTGMCYTDFAILESLLHRGPMPINTIATDIRITSGSMTTAIDRLTARGLVARSRNPADKRSRLVDLTSEGRTLIEGSYAAHAADLERIIAPALTAEERSQLFTLLRKVEKSARG
jgi:MarR family 2-MHQ and catechol resistance regulon transcriptional repressor